MMDSRRLRGFTVPVLVLALALGGAEAIVAREARPREIKAVTLTEVQIAGPAATLRLSDGSTLAVPVAVVEIKDRRRRQGGEAAPATLANLSAGQQLVIKIKHGRDGSIRRVKLQLFDSRQAAEAALEARGE
jgi:hypothetical protein